MYSYVNAFMVIFVFGYVLVACEENDSEAPLSSELEEKGTVTEELPNKPETLDDPSSNEDEVDSTESQGATEPKFSIAINEDASYTNSESVTLSLFAENATEMLISNAPGCEETEGWEAYSISKSDWTLATLNSEVSVFVKFRDAAGVESECVSDSIIHDNITPDIPVVEILDEDGILSKNELSATNLRVSGELNTNYTITISNGTIAQELSGVMISESMDFNLSPSADGAVEVTVALQDKAGNRSQASTDSTISEVFKVALSLTPSSVADMEITGGISPGDMVTMTVANLGGSDSKALQTPIRSGSDIGNFVIVSDNCTGNTLGPNETCTFGVQPVASDNGEFSANVKIGDGEVDSNSASLAGSATGFGAALALTPNSSTSMDVTGGSSPGTAVTFTLTNSGNLTSDTLQTPAITGSGSANFSLKNDNCTGNTLSASATCTFQIEPIATADQASYTASIGVGDGAINSNSVSLSGAASGFSEILVLVDEGANDSQTFTDSSSYNHTITANNQSKISNALTPPNGSTSLFLDGDGDTLSISNDRFLLDENSWQISGYFYMDTVQNRGSSVVYRNSILNYAPLNLLTNKGWGLFVGNSVGTDNPKTDSLLFEYETDAGNFKLYDTRILGEAWYHFLVSRSANEIYLFLDGDLVAQETVSGTVAAGTHDLLIGQAVDFTGNDRDFHGYLDSLKIQVEGGLVPTTSAFDPWNGDKSELYLSGQGTPAALPIRGDGKRKRKGSILGSTQYSTAQFRSGSTSIVFDGDGDRISYHDSAFKLSENMEWAIEASVYLATNQNAGNSIQYRNNIASFYNSGGPNTRWILAVGGSGDNLLFSIPGGGGSLTGTTTWTAGSWYDVVILNRHQGGSTYQMELWVNGAMEDSDTSMVMNSGPGDILTLGSTPEAPFSASDRDLDGYIADFRITVGALPATLLHPPTP